MLQIINKDKTTVAYLNNLESGKVKQVINGEYVLSFTALIEPLKTEFLYDKDNLILYNNDYFRVINIEDEHNSDNMLKVYINAEHISYDLIKQKKLTFTQTDRAAIFVMNDLLTDSGFRFLGTDVTTTASIDIQKETDIKSLLYQVATIWGGELKYFRDTIEFKQQLGINRGTDFRFGKNIENLKRFRDFIENTTAYEIDVVQGAELEELGQYYLGDTIRVADEALDNLEIDIRIIELETDIVTGLNSRVVLGQPIRDLADELTGITSYVNQKIIEFEDTIPYQIDIISTNGIVFKSGEGIVTTLIARVYKGKEDITESLNASLFKWTRVSDDTLSDEAWNASHFGGSKQINVTTEDVLRRATFFCELLKE